MDDERTECAVAYLFKIYIVENVMFNANTSSKNSFFELDQVIWHDCSS